MISKFKFFHGEIPSLWIPNEDEYGIDVESQIIEELSNQISQEIDNEIVRTLTRRINGEDNNMVYLNHWLQIGENRA